MPVRPAPRRSRTLAVLALSAALALPASVTLVSAPSVLASEAAAALVAPAAVTAPGITGTIATRQTGEPAAGVHVTAYLLGKDGQWGAVAWAETSASGSYAITGLAPGAYRVKATDWSGRHLDGFYSGAASLSTATDVVYTGTTVPSVSIELTGDQLVRVYGADRFSSSVEMVYEQYTDRARGAVDFSDVTTVIVASGDDRAAADPLAASGLCYAYQVTKAGSRNTEKGAPLVLVPGRGSVPKSVRQLVLDVAKGDAPAGINGNGSGSVRLVAVGGTATLPDSQLVAIESFARSAGVTVTRDRIAGSDRYDIARRIAERMVSRADASSTDKIVRPKAALIANGGDASKFFDALALSPISARNGAPILLVTATGVPAKTTAALRALGLPGAGLWTAGGPASVSAGVLSELKVPADHRLAGKTRYSTAVAVADKALSAGWLPVTEETDARGVVVASKLADALAGGALAGDRSFGYPLVLAGPTSLGADTSRFLSANRAGVRDALVLGGPVSTGESTLAGVKSALR